MAERRMFAKSIIDTDTFIDMPATARLLYFDLGMRADDDGFVDCQNKIIRMTGATKNDLQILIDNHFIVPFDSGVLVIVHWRIHNYIRPDRYTPTLYQTEMGRLKLQENKVYSLSDTNGIPTVYQEDAQVRLGENRLDKGSVVESDTPTQDVVISFIKAYCEEHNCSWLIQKAEHYAGYTNGDWKRNIITMIEKDAKEPPKSKAVNFASSDTDWNDVAYQIMDKENGRIDSS